MQIEFPTTSLLTYFALLRRLIVFKYFCAFAEQNVDDTKQEVESITT